MSVLSSLTLPPDNWVVDPSVLLHPQIPKPMHGLAPRVVLGEDWWENERRQAYSSTNWHCLACGVHKSQALEHQWLEGHETYEIVYPLGRMIYLKTIPLCHYCHAYIHRGRLEMMLDYRQITKLKYDNILRRGDKLLRDARLKRPKLYDGPCAGWTNWRMVVDGVEYEPLVESYEDWMVKYMKHEGLSDE